MFKPFVSFDDLYNGIRWNDTYDEFLVDTDKQKYILNIEELHKGIEDNLESNESVDPEDNMIIEDEDEDSELENDPNENDKHGVNEHTLEAF